MANSASDARASEQELRKQAIEATRSMSWSPSARTCSTPSPSLHAVVPGQGKARTPRADKVLFIDARHIYRQMDRAHRDWTHAQIGFLANVVRLYRGEELDFTLGGEEAKAKLLEIFSRPDDSNPKSAIENPKYNDVPGLCKVATLKEIEAQGWSLNPGRYVGVAPGESVSDEDFKEQLEKLNEELEKLNAQARELEETIARNVAEILEA